MEVVGYLSQKLPSCLVSSFLHSAFIFKCVVGTDQKVAKCNRWWSQRSRLLSLKRGNHLEDVHLWNKDEPVKVGACNVEMATTCQGML